MEVLSFIVLGVIVGILAGWLGVGGGILIVPLMMWLGIQQGVSENMALHCAVATSLGFITLNSLYASWNHRRYGSLPVDVFKIVLPFMVAGTLLGASVAWLLPVFWIDTIFVLLLSGILLRSFVTPGRNRPRTSQPGRVSCISVGLGAGVLASVVGIGGATVINPYMIHYQYSMKQAAAMSNALACPMGVSAIVMMSMAQAPLPNVPGYTMGYIYAPAIIGLVTGAFFGVPLGVRLVRYVSEKLSRHLFRSLLCGIMACMVV